MSDFSDLDDWANTALTPQAPVNRVLAPKLPTLPTPILVGYLVLWHRRTCNRCGSEHLELANTYECYRYPNGQRSIKACADVPADAILPVHHDEKQVTATFCSECSVQADGQQLTVAEQVLGPYMELLR